MTALLVATGQADGPCESCRGSPRPLERPGYHPYPWVASTRLPGPRESSWSSPHVAGALQAGGGTSADARSLDVAPRRGQTRLTYAIGGYAATCTV